MTERPMGPAWLVLYPSGGFLGTFRNDQQQVADGRARDCGGTLVALPVVTDYRTSPESAAEPPEVLEAADLQVALAWALQSQSERQGGDDDVDAVRLVLGDANWARIEHLRGAELIDRQDVDDALCALVADDIEPGPIADYLNERRASRP